MNVRLLRKVQKAILAEPRQFVMGPWFTAFPGLTDLDRDIPNCGTAACIAGHVCAIVKHKTPADAFGKYEPMTFAKRKLKINNEQARSLFFLGSWPDRFFDAWHKTYSIVGRAKVASRRIDHFIKSEGASPDAKQ